MKSSQKKFVILGMVIVLIVMVGTCTMDGTFMGLTNTTTSTTGDQKTEDQSNSAESKVTPYEKVGISTLERTEAGGDGILDEDSINSVAMITLPKLVVGEVEIFGEIIEDFLEGLLPQNSGSAPRSLRTNFLLSIEDESFEGIKAGHAHGLESDIQMTINYFDFLIEGGLDSISTLRKILKSPQENSDKVATFNLSLLASAKATQTTNIKRPDDFTMIDSAYINVYTDDLKFGSSSDPNPTLHGEISFSVVTTHVFESEETNAPAFEIPLAIQMEVKPFAASINGLIELASTPQSVDTDLWDTIKKILWGAGATDCLIITFETVNRSGETIVSSIADKAAFLFIAGLFNPGEDSSGSD